MARFARVVVPGHPYHITHCGNRREAVFSTPEDREVYLALPAGYSRPYGLELWASCLMTNHMHLVALPREKGSMASAVGRTRMRLCAVAEPVRARMAARAEDFPWSSCRAHVGVEGEAARGLLEAGRPLPGWVTQVGWREWVNAGTAEQVACALRLNTSTGRPTGSPGFVERLERELDRIRKRQKSGRKRKRESADPPVEDLFGGTWGSSH